MSLVKIKRLLYNSHKKHIPRRTALKNLLLYAGGTLLLPSCLQEDKKVSIPLEKIKVSGSDEDLLAALVDTIIPKTDTPGAHELGVHQYILVMVDDCSSEEDQQKFISGMNDFARRAKKELGKPYNDCTSEERLRFLTATIGSADKDNKEDANIRAFLNQTKGLTIQGYLKSEYVMKNLLIYELAPGRFHGSVPVTEKNTLVQNG